MTDRFTVRVVVLGLLLIIVLSVIAALILALQHVDMPDYLKYVGTTALGVFGGILVKTATEVQPVAVVDSPVATTDKPAKRHRDDTGLTALGALLIALIVILAFGLGVGAHPLFFLLLLLALVVLVV